MMEALGLGNVEELEGCPPQPGAPAVAGRLARAVEGQGHDDRPLGAHGHRHGAGVSDVPARLPARRDRPFYARDSPRRDRQQARVGDGDHPGARGGAPADGQVDRLHVRRLRLPDRGARGDDPARRALRGMPRSTRDPHRQARCRARDRAAVHRRAGQLRADGEPARLLARAASAELSVPRPRGRQQGLRRREDQRHLRGAGHRRVAPDEVEHRGDPDHGEAPARDRRRLHLHEPRRDRHALGAPQRPGQLPPVPAGLRLPPAGSARRVAAGRPPHRHVGPRLRPDDAGDQTTRASTVSCSPTSRGGTPPARSTRASSPTSARP